MRGSDCTCTDFRNTDKDGHDGGCPLSEARISIVPDEFPSVEVLRLEAGDIVIAHFAEEMAPDEETIIGALDAFGRALAITGHAKDCAVLAMPNSVRIEVLRAPKAGCGEPGCIEHGEALQRSRAKLADF